MAMVSYEEVDRSVSARSEVYDQAEHRAREMAERDGFVWAHAGRDRQDCYLAMADRQLARELSEEPPSWAILAAACVLSVGVLALGWYWCFGGGSA